MSQRRHLFLSRLEEGVVVDSYTTEQYREYLKYMNKFFEEDILPDEYMTMDNNALLGLVQEGTGIFYAECAMSVTEEVEEGKCASLLYDSGFPQGGYTAEEQETIDQYYTEQEAYKKSMRDKFIMGVEDINDDAVWQNYLEMMETYHTDELVAVWQAAYDRYMAQ